MCIFLLGISSYSFSPLFLFLSLSLCGSDLRMAVCLPGESRPELSLHLSLSLVILPLSSTSSSSRFSLPHTLPIQLSKETHSKLQIPKKTEKGNKCALLCLFETSCSQTRNKKIAGCFSCCCLELSHDQLPILFMSANFTFGLLESHIQLPLEHLLATIKTQHRYRPIIAQEVVPANMNMSAREPGPYGGVVSISTQQP